MVRYGRGVATALSIALILSLTLLAADVLDFFLTGTTSSDMLVSGRPLEILAAFRFVTGLTFNILVGGSSVDAAVAFRLPNSRF